MTLAIRDLHAFYGKSHVLHGVDMAVGTAGAGGTGGAAEIVALLGRNGSGRSTLAKAVMGLVDATGSITWEGREILGLRTYQVARQGIGYVPESRDVFPRLTVHQNLLLGEQRGRRGARAPRVGLDDMYAMFPRLKERQHTEAGVLSGGEQQMLTLCRTLMGDPRLVIVDEPTEGLAPRIVEQVGEALQALAARGVSVLLVEQKLTIALRIAHRCVVMGHGRIVFEGAPQVLRSDAGLRREWLEV